jgi:GPI mannosyltransferase 4
MSPSTTLKTLKHGSSRVYWFLLFVRALFALYGHGYIHPDEYFQNGELTAGK